MGGMRFFAVHRRPLPSIGVHEQAILRRNVKLDVWQGFEI